MHHSKKRNSKSENAHIKETGESPKERSAKKKAHKDIEATWTRKGNEKHDGYKNHAAVDLKTKMIRDYKVTTAKIHDSQVCEELLPEGTEAVYADSAYMGKEREEAKSPTLPCESARRARLWRDEAVLRRYDSIYWP